MATETKKLTGRELDAAALELVMGRGHDWRSCRWCKMDFSGEYMYARSNPHIAKYSTDIAAAFQLVEKLRGEGWNPSVSFVEGYWRCRFCQTINADEGGRVAAVSSFAPTAAEAITRAAVAVREAD